MHAQTITVSTPCPTDMVPHHRSRTVYGCGPRLTILNLGIRRSLVSWLAARDHHLTILPATEPLPGVDSMVCDALLIAGDRQDTAPVDSLLHCLAPVTSEFPVFGIGIGLEVVVRLAGGSPVATHCCHQGSSHTVIDRETGSEFITEQNHSVSVTAASLAGTGLVPIHEHADDGTIEGIVHPERPLAAVYYHPEAGFDSCKLLSRFLSGLKRAPSLRPMWRHELPGRSS